MNCQKKAPLCLIAKETISHLLICKRKHHLLNPNRRKNHLFGFQKKESLAPLIVEERIARSIAERKI
jgi:hypothetical protein